MRLVGLRHTDGSVLVGSLSDDGTEVSVLAGLEEFWPRRGALAHRL